MTDEIKSLQNGLAILGVALDDIEGEPVNLTPDIMLKIGFAFNRWLKKRCGKEKVTAVVGRDNRIGGEHLAQAFCLGVISGGNLVYDTGIIATTVLLKAIQDPELNCDGGAMITAGQQPSHYNGVALFTREGSLHEDDIAEILADAETLVTEFTLGGKREPVDFTAVYA